MLDVEHADDVARASICRRGCAGRPRTRVACCVWLIDRDRKSPGLKHSRASSGKTAIKRGNSPGVPRCSAAIRQWHAAGSVVAIYSCGSSWFSAVLRDDEYRDLTPLIAWFFDTAVGAKVDGESYARIAAALSQAPGEVRFISDVTRELAAARAAGLEVRLAPCVLATRVKTTSIST